MNMMNNTMHNDIQSTPMIQIVPEEQTPLGRFGHMRDEYLKANQSLSRTLMIVSGTLDSHLAEVDRQAWERFDTLLDGLTALNPPPDKQMDFLAYTQHIAMLNNMAEEIVYHELIAV